MNNQSKLLLILSIILFIICIGLSIVIINVKNNIVTTDVIDTLDVSDTIYLPVEERIDTIFVTDTNCLNDLSNAVYYIDSLEEELFICNYKLEQIRSYNDIAAKGNNIKFLRGWINRVLNE